MSNMSLSRSQRSQLWVRQAAQMKRAKEQGGRQGEGLGGKRSSVTITRTHDSQWKDPALSKDGGVCKAVKASPRPFAGPLLTEARGKQRAFSTKTGNSGSANHGPFRQQSEAARTAQLTATSAMA